MSKELRLLTITEVVNITRISQSTITKMVSNGTFPKNVHLSIRRNLWNSEDISSWINGTPGRQELKPVQHAKRGRKRLAI